MKTNPTNSFGDFTIFGFTRHPETFLQHRLPDRLGIAARVIDFGPNGHFFFYTSYGDVTETEEVIALKLGLLHSPQGDPISARQLLGQKLISPRFVNASSLRGNALVACFSKISPEFSVYKTLLSVPQLYFSRLDGGVLCTDGPKPHIALLDRVTVNEEAIPQHFLFRYVLGRHTYFDGINRLLSGELFRWHNGSTDTRLLRDLRPEPDGLSFTRADSRAIARLYEEMSSVMGAYLSDIKKTGYTFGSLISGGVDSTIMQLLINAHVSSPDQRKSFSYIMETPEFEFEVEYARKAIQFLETDHTFVTTTPEVYPELLVETTETLTFPITAESYPCKLSIAKFVEENCENVRFLFLGNGADSLHGTTLARKIALLEAVHHIPASSLILKLLATLINPLAAKKAHGLRQVAGMLTELDNPYSYKIPANITAVYSDIEMARRCFGDKALGKALEYRHYIEDLYLGSNHHIEKVHMIELLTDAYECGVVTNHLYLAHGCQQTYFFLDEDVIRIGLAFDPDIRFLKGRKVKPLLKGILEQTPFSGITKKPKGTSVFSEDLHEWMKNGLMRDMVQAIERPSFLSKSDFQKLLEVPGWGPLDAPNWFLWNLLIFDLFQKRVIKANV
jgi:asparagine synthetase B (glutamine-hydrolysing)